MFGTHDLWLFAASGLLLNITPGPDTLYIIGRSSTQGWRAGAVAALGIGAGTLVHICAAALGLSAVLAASASAFTAVKFIGAAYLLYVGAMLIRSASGTDSSTNSVVPGSVSAPVSHRARRSDDGSIVASVVSSSSSGYAWRSRMNASAKAIRVPDLSARQFALATSNTNFNTQ
jgi:hypothetical protein